jgi:hypothetical protein
LTTPSISSVEVIGELTIDFALNVHFEEGNDAWFVPQLVAFVDHAEGTQISIGESHLIRDAAGEWREDRSK